MSKTGRISITAVGEARDMMDTYQVSALPIAIKSLILGNALKYACEDSYCQLWKNILCKEIGLPELMRWQVVHPDDTCLPSGIRYDGDSANQDLGRLNVFTTTCPLQAKKYFGGNNWDKLCCCEKGRLYNIALVRYMNSTLGRALLEAVTGQIEM